MLRGVDWQLFTDVSRQPIGHIFKCPAVFLDCLTLKDVADRLPGNVSNCLTLEDETKWLSRNVGK